ncbi:hypothetical protein [Mycobacterium sp. 050134]|uniref:hypothetical protein n=1 Tax=Mycobacterium sp. 050134 TaxID=3096111 RepID=UPI002ED98A6F
MPEQDWSAMERMAVSRDQAVPQANCNDEASSLSADASTRACSREKGAVGLLAAVACTVLGAKLLIIAVLGSPAPLLDQWDGEADRVYAPHLKGSFNLVDLIAPHNEHRILATRVLALVHLELAGEWNTRLEMVFGAIVHVGLITWFAALLMPLVAYRRRLLFTAFVALLFSVPIGYENILSGFQSQVYCMLLFGVGALACFATASPFSLRWCGGLAASALSYMCFASGIATILAACILLGLQLGTGVRKRCGRELAAVIIISSIALVIILLEAADAVPKSTPWTFLQGFLLLTIPAFAGMIPAGRFGLTTLAKRPTTSDRAWFSVAILVWIVLQLMLVAYGRGTVVAVRYMDIILMIYPVALVGILALVDGGSAGKRFARYARQGAIIWVFSVVAFVAVLGYYQSVLGAVEWGKAAHQQVFNMQMFFATHRIEQLKANNPENKFNAAYPDAHRLGNMLEDPDIKSILPLGIRPPDADPASARRHLWLKGSFSAVTAAVMRVVMAIGPAMLGVGIALFFAAGANHCLIGTETTNSRMIARGD